MGMGFTVRYLKSGQCISQLSFAEREYSCFLFQHCTQRMRLGRAIFDNRRHIPQQITNYTFPSSPQDNKVQHRPRELEFCKQGHHVTRNDFARLHAS